VREKTRFLNDITDTTAEADGVPLGRGTTVDEYCSRSGKQEAVDESEERSLAAAAAAEEDKGFAGRNGKRNIGDERAGGSGVGSGSATSDTAKLDDGFA
jgi:hypothetical protein